MSDLNEEKNAPLEEAEAQVTVTGDVDHADAVTESLAADAGDDEVPAIIKKQPQVPLFVTVIAVIAAVILTAQITFLAVRQNYHKKLDTIEKSRFADAKLSQLDEIYRSNYINDIDEEKLVEGLIEGYIYGVGDKYGNYMSKDEYAAYINSLSAKSEGIGVSVIWNEAYSAIEILTVYEGSPAEAAGIQSGDLVIGVEGKSVSELGYDAAVNEIRGQAGTKVSLTIARGDGYTDTIEIEAERKTIDVKTVRLKAYGEIAVISISNFYATTPTEVKAAVASAKEQGCDRIIFDMRNNPGGLLTAVVNTLDYLLPEGDVVRTIDSSGKWQSYKSDASCVQMPMIVIVNENTASAAELFTSALKDYEYAEVVGKTTYGKGTVTSPYMLSDGSVIYLSSEHYYPPKSDNFEGKGITPDYVVELSDEAKKINFYKLTLENDDQLQKAVELIKAK